jgi:asparagine synthase (glutamine-hydrolysing)
MDLSDAGAQPMSDPQSRLLVTFNGEIYNYPELRRRLEAAGRLFHSKCDTEVLLHLYAVYGEQMVEHLCGMFAFAIWDEPRRRLFLARDPFGIKPLYWSNSGGSFRFASQVRALLAGGGVANSLSAPGVVGFLSFGYVPEPYTTTEGIRALRAGYSVVVTDGGADEERPFFSISKLLASAEDRFASSKPSDLVLRESVGASLFASVSRHLLADVPVGVFLSAGLDSSSLANVAVAAHNERVRTVTIGFDEFRKRPEDETEVAESVARELGTQHTSHFVSRAEFINDVERILSHMDQPSTDGVNSWFVSKVAAESGLKAIISGLGGDELFGSYPSFHQVPLLVRACGLIPGARRVGHHFRLVSKDIFARFSSPKYASLLEFGLDYGSAYFLRRGLFMPWELPRIIDPELVRVGWEAIAPLIHLRETVKPMSGARAKVTALELVWYLRNQLLRDIDWASMAHSLEVRTPFIDTRLFSELAPLIVSQRPPNKRHMLASLPNKVPSGLLGRKKRGFAVPVREWLASSIDNSSEAERGLRGWAKLVLSKKVPASTDYLIRGQLREPASLGAAQT